MTPAFDKYTRPHWIGVYSTRVNETDTLGVFNYWNGLYWEATTRNPERMSAEFLRPPAKVQHIEWRGFTKEQK